MCDNNPKPTYISKRGIPLITQNIDEVGYLENGDIQPILTMENYDKWYEMYIIHPDGQIQSFVHSENKETTPHTWYNHAVYPAYFHLSAKRLGCTYDSRTFATVCERFVDDVLDGDWTKLHRYLPVTP